MATPNYWIGNADPIGHKFTLVFATTATGNGAVTVTIGYKSVIIPYTTGQTAAVIAAAVSAALGVTALGEFSEYTYTYDGVATITAEHNTAGVQAAMTATTTAATGTTVTVTTTQQATGPNWINNPANWTLGLPTNAHDAIISGGPSILYGLDAPGFASDPASVQILASFNNAIGLTEYRDATSGTTYFEFRKRFWEIGSPLITIGEGTGSGPSLVNIRVPDGGTLRVVKTSTATDETQSVVNVTTKTGEAPALIQNFGGSVAFGLDSLGNPATTLAALEVNGDDAIFRAGPTHTITAATVRRGKVRARGVTTTLTVAGGEYRQDAGSLGTVVATQGTVILAHEQGTDITAQFTGKAGSLPPILDVSENNLARSLSSTSFFKNGAILNDPAGSTALDAVFFDTASANASKLGDGYNVTRP